MNSYPGKSSRKISSTSHNWISYKSKVVVGFVLTSVGWNTYTKPLVCSLCTRHVTSHVCILYNPSMYFRDDKVINYEFIWVNMCSVFSPLSNISPSFLINMSNWNISKHKSCWWTRSHKCKTDSAVILYNVLQLPSCELMKWWEIKSTCSLKCSSKLQHTLA